MGFLEERRAALNDEQRTFLNALWEHYAQKGEWMSSRRAHHRFGKPEARAIAESLGGSVLWENTVPGPGHYELTLLGTLLTHDGQDAEELLVAYLGYLRARYGEDPDVATVRSTELVPALGLSPGRARFLRRLIELARFWSGGGGTDDEWYIVVPSFVDDLPAVADLHAFVADRLADQYDPTLPIDGDERSLATLRREYVLATTPVAETESPAPAETTGAIGTADDTPPTVFVTYSHDSEGHRARVLALANRLRAEGVDCRIDRYVRFAPPEGWPRWMASQLRDANFVLVVATETYARRFAGTEQPGRGLGARWEGAIITQELYDAAGLNTRFVPVVFSEDDLRHIPEPLRGATRYVLDRDYDALYRHLTDQPEVLPPPLGPRRVLLPVGSGDAQPRGDAFVGVPSVSPPASRSPLRLVFAPSATVPTSYHQVWVDGDEVLEELFRVGVVNVGHRDVENVRVLLTAFAPQGSQNLPLPLHVMFDDSPGAPLSREGFRLPPSSEPRRFADVAFKAYSRRRHEHVLLDHIYLQHAEPGIPAAVPDRRYELTLVAEGRDVGESEPRTFIVWIPADGRLRFASADSPLTGTTAEPPAGSFEAAREAQAVAEAVRRREETRRGERAGAAAQALAPIYEGVRLAVRRVVAEAAAAALAVADGGPQEAESRGIPMIELLGSAARRPGLLAPCLLAVTCGTAERKHFYAYLECRYLDDLGENMLPFEFQLRLRHEVGEFVPVDVHYLHDSAGRISRRVGGTDTRNEVDAGDIAATVASWIGDPGLWKHT